jgi:glycosyltransferase involved in cell wall biosynthesis
MFLTVITPTYNRQPILAKCLAALEDQTWTGDYELLVVDDGSSDGTVPWLVANAAQFPHVRVVRQEHGGITAARNRGVTEAQGDTVVFVDSDVVVTPTFLQVHAEAHQGAIRAAAQASANAQGQAKVFTYGRLVATSNFEEPTSEPAKLTDFSAAYFETNNVAIGKRWLIDAGLFDSDFTQYGWEDLEMGVRLKAMGLELIKCPAAIGYHWHPQFSTAEFPNMIEKEIQRGRMGVVFYQKHPTLEVKMMIQLTVLHRILWGVLSLGGLLNERTLKPAIQWLIDRGQPQLGEQVARIFLNYYNVQGVYAAYRELGQKG